MHPNNLKGYTAHSVTNIHYLFVPFVKKTLSMLKSGNSKELKLCMYVTTANQ